MSWLSNIFSSASGKVAAQKAAEIGAQQTQAAAQQANQMAEQTQAREDARAAAIRAGQGSIEDAFGQFNPGYYDKFRQTYMNSQLPQIGDQFAEARGKLTAALAGKGTLTSTTGANAFGKLQQTRNAAEAGVANSAQDAANGLRTQVENTRSNLLNLNLNAADPASIGAQAQGAAGAIAAPNTPPSLSLGKVFEGALQPFVAQQKINAGSTNPSPWWNPYGSGSAVPTAPSSSVAIY